MFERDWAAESYKKAIELNPNYATAANGTHFIFNVGRNQEALEDGQDGEQSKSHLNDYQGSRNTFKLVKRIVIGLW